MGRAWAAVVCVVAGVFVLAGLGWALLAAGVLIYLTPTAASTVSLRSRLVAVAVVAKRAGTRLRGFDWPGRGRRVAAGVSMLPALVLVAVGVAVTFGAGEGIIAAGVGLGGFSLLSGWNR